MKIVNVNELKGGEVLADDILIDDFTILIGKGNIIKKEYIKKLNELDVVKVKIEDNSNQSEALILKKEVKQVCLIKVRNILERHTYNNNSELINIQSAAENVIQDILSDDNVCEKIYNIKERTPDIYEHSLTVCSMSTLTALKLNLGKDIIKDISVASLLHDLGLRYITMPYYNVDISKLSDNEIEEYKKHTVYGYTAVSHEKWISERAKKIILFHHEKNNGLGYPLHSNNVPIECQVLGICENFDELICGIGCEQIKVSEAIEYIKSVKGHCFDQEVVDAFFQFIAAYPIGSKVRLSDDREGIVINQNKGFPERPIIRITNLNKSSNELSEGHLLADANSIVDLVKTLNVIIKEVL